MKCNTIRMDKDCMFMAKKDMLNKNAITYECFE